MNEYFANGWDDYVAGNTVNPYPVGTDAHEQWNHGYDEAHQDELDASYMPEDDVYWSGTGELMSDDSYIDYLNNH